MPEATARRSLAARRRTTKLIALDDDDESLIDDKENSLNESVAARRQSRLLNNSFNATDEPVQTPRQLVDLYQKTVELATQGKINIKNAFSIPLVERLPQILNAIALDDDENHHLGPNFVKAGSVIDTSAKIYGFRVDALHTDTQKLCGNILNTESEMSQEGANGSEGQADNDPADIDSEQAQLKKHIRRAKAKASSYLVSDLTKITLEHEFNFRPLQPPHMCRWRGGIGTDSIYAEMVSSTMYSSSDYPLIDGFTNANSRPNEHDALIETILQQTTGRMMDLAALRGVIKAEDEHHQQQQHLGSQTLREFEFNEAPSGSFIDTIHESCLEPNDESVLHDGDDDDGYNHEELIHAAIEDLNDDPSQTSEVFKHALSELSNQDPSSMHSNLGNYQSATSHLDGLLSSSLMSNMSFADQMPHLLHAKEGHSEYSFFDATKLKLFAGPNIWKFTNLLHTGPTSTNADASTVQHQQAPAGTPRKIRNVLRETGGVKRNIRVDISSTRCSFDQIMAVDKQSREKKATGTSQSSLLLRQREKSFNQMQLARKLRELTELTNLHNFPNFNFDPLDTTSRRRQRDGDEIHRYNDQDFTDDHHDDEVTDMNYDFIRPIYYEKIQFAKGSSSVNAKNLKRQMIEEFSRQKTEQHRTLSTLDASTASEQSSLHQSQSQQPIVEFSILCENLADHGHLSLQSDLASAFYCMLINCNENKLFMRNNNTRDDLFIQEQPFVEQRNVSTLSYSYVSHSNLSMTT